MISLDKHDGQGFCKCGLKDKLRFDADHSGEIDHEETIGIIECILDGKVTPEIFNQHYQHDHKTPNIKLDF